MVIAGALPLSDNGYNSNLIVNLTERALRKNRDQRAEGTVNVQIRRTYYFFMFERNDVK